MIKRSWLFFNGAIYLILGWMFLFQFESIIQTLKIAPLSGSAAIELMAVYGGLEAGMGILFLLAAITGRWVLFSLELVTFTYISFALGRLAGILTFTVSDQMTYYLLGFEIVAGLFSLLLLKQVLTQPTKGN